MARIKSHRLFVRRIDADAAQIAQETIADLSTGHYGEAVPTHRQLYRREVGKRGATSGHVIRGRVRAEIHRRAVSMAYDVLDDVSPAFAGATGGAYTLRYVVDRIESDAYDIVKEAM